MINEIKNDYHLRRVADRFKDQQDFDVDEWVKETTDKMLKIAAAQLGVEYPATAKACTDEPAEA